MRPSTGAFVSILALALAAAIPPSGFAQSAADTTPAAAAPLKKAPRNKYGSPLDTLKSTRLWTDVPPAAGFVRGTRPDVKSLDYTPLTGVDPERPKPRDAANVQALQAELEHDGMRNEAKGRRVRGPLKTPHAKKKSAE